MRTKDSVSPNKLRGGFYSPDVLVDLCIKRASELLGQKTNLRILEPAAGDGAFFRGIARSELYQDVDSVTAIELVEEEAAKAEHTLHSYNIKGNVINENVLRWAQDDVRNFNLLLANPPYVRFQFISETDKQLAKTISSQFNINSRAVSNLWIPVFILSLGKLDEGGVFSVILPAEFLTGVSAGVIRNWILANATDMRIDLFKPGSFPSVLQEVLVLSGRKHSQDSARKDYSQKSSFMTITVLKGFGNTILNLAQELGLTIFFLQKKMIYFLMFLRLWEFEKSVMLLNLAYQLLQVLMDIFVYLQQKLINLTFGNGLFQCYLKLGILRELYLIIMIGK